MEKKLELADGRIIATYDDETGELLGLEDWHGNEPHIRWDRIAMEAIEQAMFDKVSQAKG